jgi:RND family efflux transporter MFP subunit
VRVAEVREEVVQDRRLVTGSVRAVRRSSLASREKGVVLELLVREGDVVEAGTVLARLDASRLERERGVLAEQRSAAEARVAQMQSQLERAESDLAALEVLAGKDAARPKENSDAKTARDAAKSRLAESRADVAIIAARLSELEGRIGDTVTRAPFAGTVLSRRTEVGEWIDEGGVLVEMLSTRELEVWLAVPQQYFGAVARQPGPIQVRVDGTGERLDLESYLPIPDVDDRARTFFVVAPVPPSTDRPASAGGIAAAGMSVTAWIPTGEESKRLTLPRDAILRNDVGTYVYAAVGGGDGQPVSAIPMPVEILFDLGDRSVVRSERLAPGVQVVVEGNERLYPTAPILPTPADSGAKKDGSR